MRFVLAVLAGVVGGSAFDTARADPYRWCAIMGGGQDGGMISCYFVTLDQCKATVSGVGGFCRVNFSYDGRPEGSPPPAQRSKKQHTQKPG
jgi:Protein of unknown function (DUF3551)